MDIYYKNGDGEILDFQSWPYLIATHDLFCHGWSYSVTAQRIKRIYKDVTEKTLTLNISAETQEDYCSALNHFVEVTEKDVVLNRPGCLYVGGQYLQCNIIASEKADWNKGVEYLKNTLAVVTRYPFWITERKYIFRYIASADKVFLDYPYNYAYDFASEHNTHKDTINNTHYCACHFQAIFYGPCIDPAFVVDGHLYAVMTTLEAGEYLRLDTRDRTITKVTNTGDEINEFNNQRRDVSIFEKITPGLHTVTWNGTYGIDVILYEERSEPKWN